MDQSNNHLIDTTAETVAELTINAPAAGGLVMHAWITQGSGLSGSGVASFWFQLDNTSCSFTANPFFNIAYGVYDQDGSFGTSASTNGAAAVTAGNHTVTLCGHDVTDVSVDASLMVQYASSVTTSGNINSAEQVGDGVVTPSS